MAKTPRKPTRSRPASRRRSARKPTTTFKSTATKAKAPSRLKSIRYNAGFLTFLVAHQAPYVASFVARGVHFPKGVTLTKLVHASIRNLANGKWAATTIKENKTTVVLVAFADQADFSAAQAHYNGRPWTPPILGARGGFSAIFP